MNIGGFYINNVGAGVNPCTYKLPKLIMTYARASEIFVKFKGEIFKIVRKYATLIKLCGNVRRLVNYAVSVRKRVNYAIPH